MATFCCTMVNGRCSRHNQFHLSSFFMGNGVQGNTRFFLPQDVARQIHSYVCRWRCNERKKLRPFEPMTPLLQWSRTVLGKRRALVPHEFRCCIERGGKYVRVRRILTMVVHQACAWCNTRVSCHLELQHHCGCCLRILRQEKYICHWHGPDPPKQTIELKMKHRMKLLFLAPEPTDCP